MIVSRSDTDNDDPISITLSPAYSEATVVMTSTYQTFRFNISLDKLYFSIEKCFNVGRYYGSLFCSFSVQIYRLGALGGLWWSSAVLAGLSLLP
nr:sporamin B [Ipomoea batatas]